MKPQGQVSFDHFQPKIKPGRILPQGSKIIYETSEPFNQIILPIELADLLVLCTGQFSMRDIVEKIYKRQGVVHFKSVFNTIYRLKDRGFLENGFELIDSPTRTHMIEPHQSILLRPVIEVFFGQRITNDKTHPLIFYFLSMSLIVLALLGLQSIPRDLLTTKFLRINGSYALGILYFVGLSSILLSLKSFIKAIMLLFITGRVYNFRLAVNLFGIHFKVGNESLFLLLNKLYLTIFHLSLTLSHFVGVSVLYWLSPNLPLYDQSLYIAMILTLIDLNPFSESEFSLFFKALCEDDGLNRLTAYIPNKNLLSVLSPSTNSRYQGIVLAYWHLAALWLLSTGWVLTQLAYHNLALARYSLETDPWLEKGAVLILGSLFVLSVSTTLRGLADVVLPYLARPIKNRYHRLVRRLKSSGSPEFTTESLVLTLRDLPLFSYFSNPLLEKIIKSSQVRSFPPGTRVINKGDVGRHMFVLLRGALAVQRPGPKGKETVGEILPISIFGEVAVIEDIRRTADVVTQEACVVLEIPAQVIRETSAESQYIREINDFKNAIMVAQYFASAPMFRNLPEDIVQLFLNFGKIEAIKENEVIFYQGSRGDGFYLLIRGAVGVSINGIQVKKIQQGGFFGETSVIADIPRTATVTALENTLLLRISNDAFWEIITQNIEMAMFIESVSEMRIMEDIELLNRGIPQQGQMVG